MTVSDDQTTGAPADLGRKELLRLATAGSVDDGKSTLIGRLLYDSKSIFSDQMESIERTSAERGDEYANLALLTGNVGRPGTGPELKPGMIFTIEPMINIGRPDVKLLDDGWTAVTRDRSLSAQFEHSIGITDEGCEIFTLSPAGFHQPPYV